jgi:hypothetical protein
VGTVFLSWRGWLSCNYGQDNGVSRWALLRLQNICLLQGSEKMRNALTCVLLAVACAAQERLGAAEPVSPPPPQEIYEISGSQLDSSELRPLAVLIGDAKHVGVGESTHGSDGLLEVRKNIVRFLIEHAGFRALAIESPWYSTRAANAYVQSGSCSQEGARSAVEHLIHDAWFSIHLQQLFLWLCEYNRAHPEDQAVVFGLDVQEPYHDFTVLADIIERAAPSGGRSPVGEAGELQRNPLRELFFVPQRPEMAAAAQADRCGLC